MNFKQIPNGVEKTVGQLKFGIKENSNNTYNVAI